MDLDRMDALMARLDREAHCSREMVISLSPFDRPVWPTSLREMRGEVRSLKREIRNEMRPTPAVEKRRAKQKAQRAARRRNRHG